MVKKGKSNQKSNEDLTKTKKDKSAKKGAFHIAGIGASAGGLEALKKFFTYMPPNSGIGFVLVQHLDPTHKSSMVELLSKYTSMEVIQVEDGMEVEPNKVYVIPPNKYMGISNGSLNLSAIDEPHGLRLPINTFLKSLADDRKDNSIGIILSGFGADGTAGIRAIKFEGGMVMAQDPKTAESDGMPMSAINTGLVDFSLAPEKMPDKLVSYVKTSRKIMQKLIVGEEKTEEDLQTIFRLVRSRTGHDFTNYKESTMYRRIGKRANLHQIDNLKEYIRYLQRKPDEIKYLFQELLINVTSFFRDSEAFNIIKTKAIPELMAGKNEGETIRLWIPGCSSGEEVYSLAIIIREVMESIGKYFEIQIFGTDIDETAINTARKGLYPENIKVDVSQNRLKKFFIKKEGKFQIKNEIREMAVFAVHDVLKDPPFAKLDMISCRNLLIYLKSDAQKILLSIFNYALNKDGLLFLGPSESIGESMESFNIVDKKWKIFKSTKFHSLPWRLVDAPIQYSTMGDLKLKSEHFEKDNVDITNLAVRQLLDIYAPSSVIINELGEILYIHGKIGKYLEPAPGRARLNIFDMVKDNLGFKLRSAVQNASSKEKDVVLEGLKITDNGNKNFVNVFVKHIQEPEVMRNLLIVSFEDILQEKKETGKIKLDVNAEETDKRILELEHELRDTKERLNITIEEMETSYEELKAANEELQSMNEESQSTNEELETSKEEMQSINEELATVNSELQTKIDELTRANDDMKNLFNSTEIATIFLDKEKNIRNFTPEVSALIKIRKSDVGRPIGEIVTNIKYKNLVDDIQRVLDRLVLKEKEIQTVDGNWYLMRILPYRTSEDVIDGVVVTFVDINQRMAAEEKIKDALKYAENLINSVKEPVLVLDHDLKVFSANKPFYDTFKLKSSDINGQLINNIDDGKWNLPKFKELLNKVLEKDYAFHNFITEYDFINQGKKKICINGRKSYEEGAERDMVLLTIDVENCID